MEHDVETELTTLGIWKMAINHRYYGSSVCLVKPYPLLEG